MELEKVFTDYVNRYHHPRKISRYWSSEIQSIIKGYLTPESFFNKGDIPINGCRLILVGIAMEHLLTKIFKEQNVDCKMQEKRVLKITPEIELVVKPDFIFPDYVLETKYPFSIIKPGVIPEKYKMQLECESRAFNKPVYLGLFSVPFNVTFIEYTPSDYRWRKIKRILIDFDKKVREQQAKNLKEKEATNEI